MDLNKTFDHKFMKKRNKLIIARLGQSLSKAVYRKQWKGLEDFGIKEGDPIYGKKISYEDMAKLAPEHRKVMIERVLK